MELSDILQTASPSDRIAAIARLCRNGGYRCYLFRRLPHGAVFIFVDSRETEMTAVRIEYAGNGDSPCSRLCRMAESSAHCMLRLIEMSDELRGQFSATDYLALVESCSVSADVPRDERPSRCFPIAPIEGADSPEDKTRRLLEMFGGISTRFVTD